MAARSNQYGFPDALLQAPRCFVALAGLDVRNNAVHRVVWDMFTTSSRSGEKKPVTYKHVRADYLYPKRKSESVSNSDADGGGFTGILRHNWLRKHSQELPAVVVFFFDLEWDDPQWEEKVTECASKIKVIRAALDGRQTELAVALIQTAKPRTTPQGGYDAHTTELANQLCTECDIPGPSLYILPFVDRPEGYIVRLESTFYEQALRYYSNKIKKIKGKDIGGKPVPTLSIRRQFKTGFFLEFKQEPKEALKVYQSAYRTLTEVMSTEDEKIMQFKIMAGYLNYKICQLIFNGHHDDPRSAPPQFQRHIDLFRKEIGLEELAFEHHNWMAQQYHVFGDLFSEAIKKNLNPIQTLHPGIHYHQAALHILKWKRLQRTVCRAAHSSFPHPLPNRPTTDYLGELPWRKGLSDSQPSDPDLRKSSITLLQALEYTCDLSLEAVVPLTKAMEQFKRYRADQMMQHLKVLLGQEYYTANQFDKSLTMLDVAVKSYRKQRWHKLLATVQVTMLKCSYLLGRAHSYIVIALEMISRFFPHSEEEKRRIHRNLSLVLNGRTPIPEPGLDQSQIESAEKEWSRQFNVAGEVGKEKEKSVDMSTVSACVECKCVFSEESYTSDSAVELTVHFRSSAPLPILCSQVQVLLDDKSCNGWCVVNEKFTLEPGKHSSFTFSFPSTNDMLQVVAVELKLAGERGREVILLWNGGVSDQVCDPRDWSWNKIENRTCTM